MFSHSFLRALLPCLLVLFLSQNAAAQDTPSNADMWEAIQKQQAEIEALKQENRELKERMPDEQQSRGSLTTVGREEQDVPQSAGEFSVYEEEGPEEVGASFEVFGFVQADAIYDFDRVDPDWNDGSRPSKIPVQDPGEFGADGESIVSVRQSRLGFRSTTPTSMGAINAWLEWDLYGTGNDAGDTTLNLRHFWAELGSWGAGQTWTGWMDIDIFPNTIDYWGPTGMVFIRKPQVRYTHQFNNQGTLWSISLEDPDNDIDTGKLREIEDVPDTLLESIDTKDSLFDVTSRFRSENDWGHWQLGGIIRRLEYEAKGTPDNDPSGTDWGWGLNFTTVASTFGRDKLKFGLVYGEGIASYFNDGGTSLGPDNINSNDVDPIESLGVSIYYDHYWDDNWSTSFGWSMHDQDNLDDQADNAFNRGQLAQANLLWTKEEFMTGFEAIWSERKDNNGESNTDFRVQYSFKFNFAHTLVD